MSDITQNPLSGLYYFNGCVQTFCTTNLPARFFSYSQLHNVVNTLTIEVQKIQESTSQLFIRVYSVLSAVSLGSGERDVPIPPMVAEEKRPILKFKPPNPQEPELVRTAWANMLQNLTHPLVLVQPVLHKLTLTAAESAVPLQNAVTALTLGVSPDLRAQVLKESSGPQKQTYSIPALETASAVGLLTGTYIYVEETPSSGAAHPRQTLSQVRKGGQNGDVRGIDEPISVNPKTELESGVVSEKNFRRITVAHGSLTTSAMALGLLTGTDVNPTRSASRSAPEHDLREKPPRHFITHPDEDISEEIPARQKTTLFPPSTTHPMNMNLYALSLLTGTSVSYRPLPVNEIKGDAGVRQHVFLSSTPAQPRPDVTILYDEKMHPPPLISSISFGKEKTVGLGVIPSETENLHPTVSNLYTLRMLIGTNSAQVPTRMMVAEPIQSMHIELGGGERTVPEGATPFAYPRKVPSRDTTIDSKKSGECFHPSSDVPYSHPMSTNQYALGLLTGTGVPVPYRPFPVDERESMSFQQHLPLSSETELTSPRRTGFYDSQEKRLALSPLSIEKERHETLVKIPSERKDRLPPIVSEQTKKIMPTSAHPLQLTVSRSYERQPVRPSEFTEGRESMPSSGTTILEPDANASAPVPFVPAEKTRLAPMRTNLTAIGTLFGFAAPALTPVQMREPETPPLPLRAPVYIDIYRDKTRGFTDKNFSAKNGEPVSEIHRFPSPTTRLPKSRSAGGKFFRDDTTSIVGAPVPQITHPLQTTLVAAMLLAGPTPQPVETPRTILVAKSDGKEKSLRPLDGAPLTPWDIVSPHTHPMYTNIAALGLLTRGVAFEQRPHIEGGAVAELVHPVAVMPSLEGNQREAFPTQIGHIPPFGYVPTFRAQPIIIPRVDLYPQIKDAVKKETHTWAGHELITGLTTQESIESSIIAALEPLKPDISVLTNLFRRLYQQKEREFDLKVQKILAEHEEERQVRAPLPEEPTLQPDERQIEEHLKKLMEREAKRYGIIFR